MDVGVRILSEQELNSVSSTKQVQFGAEGVTADGRRYKYVGFGGTSTINSGILLVAPAAGTNSTGLVIPALTSQPSTTALQSGSFSFTVTNGATAVTQDQYQFVEVINTAGTFQYRLKGHTAAAGAGAIILSLGEPLVNPAALVPGTDTVNLIYSPYNACAPSLTQRVPVGVTVTQVPNTSSVTNYGWVQVGGKSFVNATSATIGQAVKQDTSGTAGFVAVTSAATDYQIGAARASAASSTASVHLSLA